jgi:hypothetical protein
MDPVTLTGTFATLVGLLANFKAERSGTDLAEFMSWLKEQHQDQIWSRIDADKRLTQELKALLSREHSDLVSRLAALTEQIAQLASHIDGFAGLSNYLAPSSPLSEQAQRVIRELVGSGAEYALEVEADGTRDFLLVGAAAGQELTVTEPHFIIEDFELLAAAGLVRIDFASRGSRKVVTTRLGHTYVRHKEA